MSRKRGKDKRAAKQAVPEEILAEGSGPNEVVEANAQSLADAASDALGPVADVEVRADAGDEPAPKKRGKKTRATTDAWGQPIVVSEDEVVAAATEAASDAGEPSEHAIEVEAAEAAEEPAPARGKKGKRKTKASRRSVTDDDAEIAEMTADAQPTDSTAMAEEMSASDEASEESSDEALETASDDTAMDAEPGELTAEAQSEQALEDAVMRAEAEAELGEGEEPAEGDDVEIEGVVGAALPTTAASMDAAQLKNLVEALVFAADKPVTLQRLRQLTRVSDVKRLEEALAAIAADFKDRGIALQQVSGGYQFRTNTQYSVWVQQLIAGRPVRLSRAQLETLAIVAYRQPITRPEVDEIRGVDSSATLRLLLDRSLIRVLGKKEDVGRPTLYGTTKEFLDFFSLSDLRELPTLREYSELTAESRKVMSDRLGIDADGNAVEDEGADAEGDASVTVDAAPDLGDVAAAGAVADLESPADADESAPEIDVEAQLAADDAAAVEAVSAVTGDVVGIVEADAGSTDFAESMHADAPDADAMAAGEYGTDAHVGADAESMSAGAVDVESMPADGDDAASMNAGAPDDESTAAEKADRGDADVDADAESMNADADDVASIRAGAADVESMSADGAIDDESIAADVHRDDVHVDADADSMSAGGVADGVVDDESVSAVDAHGDDAHVGADADSMSAGGVADGVVADESMAVGESDRHDAHVGADAESMSAGAADAESMHAVAEHGSDAESMHAADAVDGDAADVMSHSDDDKGAMFASTLEQELGAPRGSSQDDVIAISHDAAHDPDELGTDDPHDLDVTEGDGPDDLEPTGDDVGIAGAGVLEDGEADIEAGGTPNPEVIDASAPDSLDETDEPPAD